MATNNKNTDWRAKYRAMMTDPNYAEKMASAVENTRKVNTNLMNKSEELGSSLSFGKPTSQPLDLSRVQEMQTEQVARATMPTEGEEYSGVADLATKLYAEERERRGKEATKNIVEGKTATSGSPFAATIGLSAGLNKASNVGETYDAVLKNEALIGAVRTNANKALVRTHQ